MGADGGGQRYWADSLSARLALAWRCTRKLSRRFRRLARTSAALGAFGVMETDAALSLGHAQDKLSFGADRAKFAASCSVMRA